MPLEDLLADAIFVASLTQGGGIPLGARRLNPDVLALVRAATRGLPWIVRRRQELGEWEPLLKVDHGDELADRAAATLKALLETCSIKSEVRSNPWMTDGSKYLFVNTDSLVKAVEGATK